MLCTTVFLIRAESFIQINKPTSSLSSRGSAFYGASVVFHTQTSTKRRSPSNPQNAVTSVRSGMGNSRYDPRCPRMEVTPTILVSFPTSCLRKPVVPAYSRSSQLFLSTTLRTSDATIPIGVACRSTALISSFGFLKGVNTVKATAMTEIVKTTSVSVSFFFIFSCRTGREMTRPPGFLGGRCPFSWLATSLYRSILSCYVKCVGLTLHLPLHLPTPSSALSNV